MVSNACKLDKNSYLNHATEQHEQMYTKSGYLATVNVIHQRPFHATSVAELEKQNTVPIRIEQ